MSTESKIKFGPAGNSDSFYAQGLSGTENTATWLKDRNLDSFEYSFGRGINMGDAKAVQIRETFKSNEIEISFHAPYYINFCNENAEEILKSCQYIIDSVKMCLKIGGRRVVFHTGAIQKDDRAKACSRTFRNLEILIKMLDEQNLKDIYICPETMGKINQMGTLEEVIEICKMDGRFIPCIDFGHLNAREKGSLKTVKDFDCVIEKMLKEIPQKAKIFHAHFSKIQYGEQGEIKHLTFEDNFYGPDPELLIQSFKNFDVAPYVICESKGTQAEDAMFLKSLYFKKV